MIILLTYALFFQMRYSFLCLLEYRVTRGKHCRGHSLVKWSDGSRANYGRQKGLETCKTTCNAHVECAGFVSRSDGICGFWKRGPLNPYDKIGHDCYEKIGDYH